MNEPATATLQRPESSFAEGWFLTHAALDFLDQGISVYDRNLHLVGWNRRFFELLDFPQELARVGTPFAEFIRYNAQRGEYGPGDPERQVAERVDLALRFESHCFERIRPDGTVLEVRGNPIADGGFVTIYSDVTERKRAEAALQESHEQLETRVAIRTAKLEALNQRLTMEVATREQIAAALRERERWLGLITDAVPALIAYVDAERRYVFVNRKYEEWFGIPIDEILGRRYGTLLEPVCPPRLQKAMDMALGGYAGNLDREVTSREGRTLHLRCSLVPHLGTDGQVLGFFSLAHDLTEYRKTQAALSQALKMEAIGQLTSGIAHDFKNLLTVIVGNLALLEEDLAADAEAQDSVATAMSAARRGAALTRRLLAFSRHQPLEPRVLEPHRLMTSIDAFLRCTLGETVAVKTRADDEVWNVLADPNQLTNALLNLAINARDAMPEGGRLKISAANALIDEDRCPPDAEPGEYVLLCVADDGVGMAPEIVEHVFEPFFSTKATGDGSGLGLSMVYGFVKQSKGFVEINSEPGCGTEIRLYLPRAGDETDEARTLPASLNR